jgi:serine protease Do
MCARDSPRAVFARIMLRLLASLGRLPVLRKFVSSNAEPAQRACFLAFSIAWRRLRGLTLLGMLAALFLWSSASAETSARVPPALSALEALSGAVQVLARRVHPCVVKVVAMGYLDVADQGADQGVVTRGQSSGSGVIIDPDGYIVTNAHVLSGADNAQVTLPASALSSDREGWSPGAGKTLVAQVVGIDAETDVALLRVSETGLPFLPLTPTAPIHQGDVVLAFGSPMGLEDSVSLGIVSSVARQFEPEDMIAYIQTDAPINPGSSGGPLVDAAGRMVGINTLFLSESGASEGLGFAMPVDLVAAVVEQLRYTGRAVRAYLGLDVRSVSPALAAAWTLPAAGGVVVQDVEREGPAQDTGIEPGDLIASVDGQPLANLLQLNIRLYRAAAHTRLKLTILRAGRRLTVPVEVRDRETSTSRLVSSVRRRNLIPQLGVFVTDIDEDLSVELSQERGKGGVLVVAALVETPALGEDLEVGDIIYRMNRQPVTSSERLRELVSATRTGDPVAFQVEREGQLRFVAADIP